MLLPDAEGARRAPLPAVAPRAPRSFVALRTDAEAGDVGAQIDLGVWLARCITQGEPGYADTIVRQYEATAASGLPGTQWRGALLDQQRTVRDRLLLEHADCVLLAESGIEPSHVWLERAARSGDIEAKVAYAARALDEFVRVDADVAGGTVHYLDNLEEIVRRRDLGRRWLADALRAGSVDALQLLARAYAGDHPLYPPDPRQAAIHRHALALAQARLSGDAAQLRSVWHGGPQGIADEGLGPADRPAIDAAARRIYLQWFGPDPEEG
ncbi:hypothetical protein [Chiayiivirga flava]|uniref:TPR repeat protein n=1 Tax=Chiayiivirga flava TaxID=659595 RepID=A0A7W8D5V3_9GAMM|nr:hypothetical protein [Chiayiivirga flava]MBB5208489.1 TPR repeat protein [Chiayiivirga flava]